MATPKKEKLQVVEKSTDEVKIIPQNSSTQVTVAVHLPNRGRTPATRDYV